jgi:transposase
MRCGDGGGVDQVERVRRERVRQRAAALFAEGRSAVQVAGLLQVSTKSAYQWRRAWVAGGAGALASRGPAGPDPKLSDQQLARLKARLELGPAAAGYGEDQRWTLARIVALIATMFHIRIGVTTAWQAMRRLGYTALLRCGIGGRGEVGAGWRQIARASSVKAIAARNAGRVSTPSS